MFERLFVRAPTLARHRAGPLAEERARYLTWLAGRGMAIKSLREAAGYLLAIVDYLRLADRSAELITHEDIAQQASRWAKRRRTTLPYGSGGRTSRGVFLWRATDWLQFLGRLQQPPVTPTPFAEEIAAFTDYMRRERGFAEATIFSRCWLVRRFFDRLGTGVGSLHEITITRIDAVLGEMLGSGKYARFTVRDYTEQLRAFFRYAEKRGWCRSGLAGGILSPRLFKDASLPVGPSWDDVQRLLETTEGDRRIDLRDRAILLLLTVYALRAGEVTRLRLEDFDWEQELLTVRCSKSRQVRTYPLSRPVGDAVLRYLREVRPRSTHREVFLALRAPIQPLQNLGILVARRWWSLDLKVPHEGTHALRHACATHLLAQGLSLKEIGDHLGHRHPDSTRIYAKVDLGGLRQVGDFDMGGLL